MEIHQLRYVCAVAETGSFTRGARREHVTQPSLSQQIIKLEAEVGAQLFDRLKNHVRLTEAGRTFLRTAKAILNLTDQAANELKHFANQPEGSVMVGAIPTVAPSLVPPVLKSLQMRYPLIEVRIIEDLQTGLLPKLRQGIIDVALIHLPLRGDDLRTGTLCRQSLYVAMHADHALADRKFARLRQFRNDKFLLLREGFQFRVAISEAFRAARIRPAVVFESLSFGNLLAMVAVGAGVSLVPEMALEKKKGCKFIPLSDLRGIQEIGWAALKRHVLSPAQKLFINELRSAFATGNSRA